MGRCWRQTLGAAFNNANPAIHALTRWPRAPSYLGLEWRAPAPSYLGLEWRAPAPSYLGLAWQPAPFQVPWAWPFFRSRVRSRGLAAARLSIRMATGLPHSTVRGPHYISDGNGIELRPGDYRGHIGNVDAVLLVSLHRSPSLPLLSRALGPSPSSSTKLHSSSSPKCDLLGLSHLH